MKNILKLRFWFYLIITLGCGYAASLGIDSFLHPSAKYELKFEPGTARSCRVDNNRLWIESFDPERLVINGSYASHYQLYSLETGRYVSELNWSVGPTPTRKALPLPSSLPVDSDRYVLSTDSRGRTTLLDLVTDQWYQFHGFEPNEDALSGSNSIESFTADALLSTSRVPLQLLFPPPLYAGLATPLLWTSQQSSLHAHELMPLLLRLLRVPDKRELGRVLLGPGICDVKADYSPSLKRLIVRTFTTSRLPPKGRDDFRHDTLTPMFWDFAQARWQATAPECSQCQFRGNPCFQNEDIVLSDLPNINGNITSGIIHVPTGKFVDTLRNTWLAVAGDFRPFSMTKVNNISTPRTRLRSCHAGSSLLQLIKTGRRL